jgi:indolepyruvate ferredoxin oxidoreductase beta subunit
MLSATKPQLPDNRPFNILVAGVGGQGILLAARFIAQAATSEGFDVSVGETFGASRRGGTVLSHIRLNTSHENNSTSRKITLIGSLIPHHMADVLIGLEPLETLRAAQYLTPNSQVLLNEHLQPPVDVISNRAIIPSFKEMKSRITQLVSNVWTVNALQLARQAGEIRTANTVMVGALAGLNITPISHTTFESTLQSLFPIKSIQVVNNKAYQIGKKAFS